MSAAEVRAQIALLLEELGLVMGQIDALARQPENPDRDAASRRLFLIAGVNTWRRHSLVSDEVPLPAQVISQVNESLRVLSGVEQREAMGGTPREVRQAKVHQAELAQGGHGGVAEGVHRAATVGTILDAVEAWRRCIALAEHYADKQEKLYRRLRGGTVARVGAVGREAGAREVAKLLREQMPGDDGPSTEGEALADALERQMAIDVEESSGG